MDEFENKSSFADRSKDVFLKFLETHGIDYVANGDRVEFERGSRYMVIFGDVDILLCDQIKGELHHGGVFEIMHYIIEHTDAFD